MFEVDVLPKVELSNLQLSTIRQVKACPHVDNQHVHRESYLQEGSAVKSKR